MDKEYFDVLIFADDTSYEGQLWPDHDQNDQLFCQLTYHKTGLPSESRVIYVERKQQQWVQKIMEDGEHMASPSFMAALNKEVDFQL